MCVRFGNAHDTERFRSELYSRNVAQGSPLLLFTRIYIGCWHLLFPVILTWNHGSSNTVAKHCMCPNCLQLLQEHAKVYAVCVVELLTACYFSRHSMHFCGNQSTPHQCMHKWSKYLPVLLGFLLCVICLRLVSHITGGAWMINDSAWCLYRCSIYLMSLHIRCVNFVFFSSCKCNCIEMRAYQTSFQHDIMLQPKQEWQ